MATPPWQTPPSNANGTPWTATNIAAVAADLNHVGAPPLCVVTNASSFTVTTGTFTDCAFDNELEDSDGFHDNVTNNARMTVPANLGGWYQLRGVIVFPSNATGNRTIAFAKNGSLYQQVMVVQASGAGITILSGVWDIQLAAGDYVTMQVWQGSGGTLTIGSYTTGASPAGASFAVRKISN